MKNLIRKIAKLAGMATDYHVAAMYWQDSHMSSTTMSMTVTLRPWLHSDNYMELIDFLHKQATRPTADMPVITSITKLGA